MTIKWHYVGKAGSIEDEDVMRYDLGDQTFAIYYSGNTYYATAGMCTHEAQHLAEGFVFDDVIECPLHQGRFNIKTGEALSAPVCVNLLTFEVKQQGDDIFIGIPET